MIVRHYTRNNDVCMLSCVVLSKYYRYELQIMSKSPPISLIMTCIQCDSNNSIIHALYYIPIQ